MTKVDFGEILTYNFWGNSLKEYLIAFGIFILAIAVLKFFKAVIIARVKKLVNHTETDLDDLIIKILDSVGWPFYFFVSLYLSFLFVQLPEIIKRIGNWFVLILVIYYITKSVQLLIDYGFEKIVKKKRKSEEKFDPSILELLSKIIKGITWAAAIIIILENHF